MILFSRVRGINGSVRELSSIIDFNSEYSVISSGDAIALGFNEGSVQPKYWRKSHPDKVPYILDIRGIERANIFTLPEVSLGLVTATNVDVAIIELGIPRAAPFDMILGRSFLKNFKFSVDMIKGYMTLVQQTREVEVTREKT